MREFLTGRVGGVAIAICTDLIGRIERLARCAGQLKREIDALAETGDVRRFRSATAYAMRAGHRAGHPARATGRLTWWRSGGALTSSRGQPRQAGRASAGRARPMRSATDTKEGATR